MVPDGDLGGSRIFEGRLQAAQIVEQGGQVGGGVVDSAGSGPTEKQILDGQEGGEGEIPRRPTRRRHLESHVAGAGRIDASGAFGAAFIAEERAATNWRIKAAA